MGGVGYADLAKALSGGGQQYQSPWLAAAQALPQAPAGNDIEQMIGGITKALMAGYGMYDQNQEQARTGQMLAQAFSPNADQASMARLLANPQTAPIAIFQLQNSQSKATKDAEFQNELLKIGFTEQIKAANDPQNLRRLAMKMPGAIDPQAIYAQYLQPKTLGQNPQGGTMPVAPPQSQATTEMAQPIPVSSVAQQAQQDSGFQAPLTLAQKAQKLATEIEIGSGIPPLEAYKAAQAQLEPEIQNTAQVLKGFSEARQMAQKSLNASKTVLSALDTAGTTGPGDSLRSAYLGTANFLQGIAPGVDAGNTDVGKQITARQIIESTVPTIVSNAKVGIAGALSEGERAMYESAGPGTSRTPEANALLAKTGLARAQFDLSYLDFAQEWLRKYGSIGPEMDQAWQNAMGDYSPLVMDPRTKQPIVNENIPNWKERLAPYFGGQPNQNPTVGRGSPENLPQAPQSRSIDPSTYGIRPELVKAITEIESSGNPNAVSPKGAVGLMQILPSTAKEHLQAMGLIQPGASDDQIIGLLKDPDINQEVGLREFSTLLKQYKGDEKLALAAYNAGQGNVAKYGNQIPPFPETQQYVQKIASKTPLYGPGEAQAEGLASSPPLQQAAEPQQIQQIQQAQQQAPQDDYSRYYKRGVTADQAIGDVRQLYQGAAANFGDEAMAAMQMVPQLGKRFGTPEEKQQFANELELRRTAIEQQLNDYADKNPGRAAALRTGGSLMTLPLIPAKTPIIGATALKNASALGRVARAGAGGGIFGATYGAGDAAPGQRLEKAIEGATIGVPAGLSLGTGIEGIAGALKLAPNAVKSTIGNLSRLGKDEAGAIMPKGEKVPQMSPGGAALYKAAGKPSGADLEKALGEMINAENKGGALLPAEALDQSALYDQGQYLLNLGTSETRNMADKFISERSGAAGTRMEKLFEGQGTRLESAKNAQEGAEALWAAEVKKRSDIARPMFDNAFKTVPKMRKSQALRKILDTDPMEEAIREARKFPGNKRLAENDSKIIQGAAQYLGEKVKTLSGDPKITRTEVARYQRVFDDLTDLIKEKNKPLHEARTAFAKNSEFINELDNTQIRVLGELRKGDPISAVDKLVRLEPERITGLRAMFEKNNQLPAWNDAVRSYVAKLKSATNEETSKSMLKNLIGSDGAKARLKAMLGDEMYSQVEPMLSLEKRYAEGAGKYFLNSKTAKALDTKEQTQSVLGKILKLVSMDKRAWADVAGGLLNTTPSEAVLEDMARIMFSPQGGKEWLQSAIPFARGYDAYNRGVGALRKAGTRSAPVAGGRAAKR